MAGFTDSLGEYLVKIGWDVDVGSFRTTKGLFDLVLDGITKKLGPLGGAFANLASFAVTGLMAVNKTMVNLLSTTARLDLATERYARRMWTTEQNARSFTTALSALGMSESDFFYATDEEIQRFRELRALGNAFQEPKELEDTLVLIRDIQFEFSKFKVLATYGSRMVAYYLKQYLGTTFEDVRNKLRQVTDWATKNLPKIAQFIARIFAIAYQLLYAAVYPFIEAIKFLINLWNSFNTSLKVGITGIGTAIMLLKSGPLGWLIAAIVGLLLLIDDYIVWSKGGKSLFDWSKFQEGFDHLTESLKPLVENLNELSESISRLFEKLGLKDLLINAFQLIIDLLGTAVDLAADFVDSINVMLERFALLKSLLSGDISIKEFFEKNDEITSREWGKLFNNLGIGDALGFAAGGAIGRGGNTSGGGAGRGGSGKAIEAVSVPTAAYGGAGVVSTDNRDQRQTNYITIHATTMSTADQIADSVVGGITRSRYTDRGVIL